MRYKHIYSIYFSPTGTTERIAKTIADHLAQMLNLPVTHISYTLPKERETVRSFSPEDIVVLGAPVYAGRVPNVLLPYLKTLVGAGAIAIPVVLFGNRAFEDALIELRDIMVKDGFKTVAAGVFVGEHSMSNILAAGRPNEDDLALVNELVQEVSRKVCSGNLMEGKITVPGTEAPYRPYFQLYDRAGHPVNFLKAKPKTNENCNDCKLCAEICPMGSIDYDDVTKFNSFCIKCGACIKQCPQNAKYFDDPVLLEHIQYLEETYSQPAKSEIFY